MELEWFVSWQERGVGHCEWKKVGERMLIFENAFYFRTLVSYTIR